MKKRIVVLLGVIIITVNLIACGQSSANVVGENNSDESIVEVSDTMAEESKEKETEEDKEEDLPNWRGVQDYLGYSVYTEEGRQGKVRIDIEYPSLKPTSWGWAYQMDPTYVLVTSAGVYDGPERSLDILVDTLENTFEVSKEYICKLLASDRDHHYDDFDFIVETQEPVTINDLSMYKYMGTHTYTYDGEQRECDFVAYSVDTQQVEHAYITLIVMDDSLSHPSMDPVPEGTIEAYARKMAESISVRE